MSFLIPTIKPSISVQLRVNYGKVSWPKFPRKVISLVGTVEDDILTFRLGFRKKSRRGYSKKRLATEEKGGQLKRFRSGKGPCTSVSSISRRPLIVQEERSTGTFLGIMALLTTSSTPYKSFDGSTCCVVENSRISDHSTVETRIKQGCVMSGFLFNIIVNWTMQNTTNARGGLSWKFTMILQLLGRRHSPSLKPTQRSPREVQSSQSGLKVPDSASHHQDKDARNECQDQ